MGFWSAVCSVVSSVCSAVSSAVSYVAGAVGSVISAGLRIVVGMGKEVWDAVCTVAQTIGRALGLIEPEERLEDLGDRALQAAEQDIRPEKYEKYEEYLKALRELKLDPEKSEKFSVEEKNAAGLTVLTLGLADRFKMDPAQAAMLWPLIAKNPDFFTAERVTHYLKEMAHPGLFVDYFTEKTRDKSVEAVIFKTERSFHTEETPPSTVDIFSLLDANRVKATDMPDPQPEIPTHVPSR